MTGKEGGSVSMNYKAQDATEKIMVAFDSGGLVPLDVHQYAVIDAHVRSILARAMETPEERAGRKRADFQRVLAESK
jgi:hypothetical protein